MFAEEEFQRIEQLRKNKEVFGEMSEGDQELFRKIGKDNCQFRANKDMKSE